MRFRREMHDVGDGVLFDDAHHGGLVAQVHLLKNIFRVFGNLFQIFRMPRVGEAIEIDKSFDLRTVNDVVDQVGADEARAAGEASKFITLVSSFSTNLPALPDRTHFHAGGQKFGNVHHAIGAGRFGGDTVKFLVVPPEFKLPAGLAEFSRSTPRRAASSQNRDW